MINTIVNNNKQKLSLDNILNDIYLLPKWEMIKSFALTQKKFFIKAKSVNVNLFRKFSSKNLLEKYSLRNEDGISYANMTLKVYKDCLYIIDLDIENNLNFAQITEKLLQVAIEKALYNTENKEVFINLPSGLISKNRLKKILLLNGFSQELNQTDYEKDMFGETFSMKIENNSSWVKTIKQMPILINK